MKISCGLQCTPFEGRLIGMMVKRSANTSGTFFEQFGWAMLLMVGSVNQ
jgi:hypothetical protein